MPNSQSGTAPTLRWQDVAAVALGGVLGALARYGLSSLESAHWAAMSWSVTAVNISGSCLIGIVMSLIAANPRWGPWRPFLVTGFLGGYTTFSGFALAAFTLADGGRVGAAVLFAGVNIFGSLFGVFAGWRVTAWMRSTR